MSKVSRMQLDLREGTIEFTVEKNKLRWNDGLIQVFVNLSNEQGNIFIVKDSDNKLKFFHVLTGKGRTDVEIDVSKLSINEPHYIIATWSVSKKEIFLYIDGGKQYDGSDITY